MTMELLSPAFVEGGPIPVEHTCDGEDRSPALRWSGVPVGTRSLALKVDDPDAPAGLWVHWLIWNLDPGDGGLSEGTVPAGAVVTAFDAAVGGHVLARATLTGRYRCGGEEAR